MHVEKKADFSKTVLKQFWNKILNFFDQKSAHFGNVKLLHIRGKKFLTKKLPNPKNFAAKF
jgi:hypothetical protein